MNTQKLRNVKTPGCISHRWAPPLRELTLRKISNDVSQPHSKQIYASAVMKCVMEAARLADLLECPVALHFCSSCMRLEFHLAMKLIIQHTKLWLFLRQRSALRGKRKKRKEMWNFTFCCRQSLEFVMHTHVGTQDSERDFAMAIDRVRIATYEALSLNRKVRAEWIRTGGLPVFLGIN